MFPIKPMPESNNFANHPTESRQQNASQKFIASVFSKIVFLWPADFRDWALAMQAELPQMESTQESLHWLAGGIMSLGKAWWNGALSSESKKDLAPVKKPGILAALVTVAALAILMIPSANQGLRAVLTSWQPDHDAAQQAQFMRIARDAESRGDAKTLAFAAMRLWPRKDFVYLANKAVAMDPSLTWIFSQGYFGNFYVPEARDWPAKLEAWDPGNSVAYLVQAQIRSAEFSHNGMIAIDDLRNDPQWLEAGRKAMESPRYDTYRNRRIELDRDVYRTRGLKDLDVIAVGAFRYGWISLWPAQNYSKRLLDDAKLAAARGDIATAKRDAWAVAHFGELLRAQGGTESERLSSIGYLRPAYTILQPLLAAEGRTDEAKMLSQELEAIRPGAPAALSSYWLYSSYGWWRTASVAMNFGVVAALLLAIALLFAGFWLFAARFVPGMNSGALYGFACRSGRYAPAGLLVSLAVLASSYSPAAESVRSYLQRPISTVTLRNISESYESVYWLPDTFLNSPGAPYHAMFWLMVTVFGTLTILTIIGRNILNRTMRMKAA